MHQRPSTSFRRSAAGLSLGRVILFALAILLGIGAVPGAAATSSSDVWPSKSIKILAIGNSYSTDALEHLHWIAKAAGAEEVILANLYIGSSGLSHHWDNARANAPAYRYDKNVNGTWVRTPNQTLIHGIKDEDWDLITMHQRGMLSGTPESFNEQNRLDNLIAYIKEHRTNPNGRIGWQMTWAYESGSNVATLVNTYNGDQMAMYNAIVNAVETVIAPHPELDLFIPVGTALQNVRTSYIGDSPLTRDGHHLSYNLGRYIAGMTWLHAITGWSIDDIIYVPNAAEIPGDYMPVIKEAVKAAVQNPFEITPSGYTTRPQLPQVGRAQAATTDYGDDYMLLDWEPAGCAYWNSRNTAGLSTTLISQANSTASNLCYFVSSGKMFTRDDLPVGTIIEVDPGFQYRPEGWVSLTTHTTRPAGVTTPQVVVTEQWWGDFAYRAFNVSYAGSTTDVRGTEDDVAAAFRIYVPAGE